MTKSLEASRSIVGRGPIGQADPDDGSTSRAALERCSRCEGTADVIDGDGRNICRRCLMAWGSFAAMVVNGPVVTEASRAELEHNRHFTPVALCQLCWQRSMQRPVT